MISNILFFSFVLVLVLILIALLNLNKIINRLTNYKEEYGLVVKYSLILSLVLILFSFFAPYFFTSTDIGKSIVTTTDTGLIGDTMGGIMNPFIAIAASILTFIAFWIQYKANEQQKQDLQIERFENKFYSMLQIHRDNVNETTIGKSLMGRKSFIFMFNELKFTYHSTKLYYDSLRETKTIGEIDEETIYNISYLIFFFGIGNNSSLIVRDLIGEEHLAFVVGLERYLEDIVLHWKSLPIKNKEIAVDIENDQIFTLKIGYIPFNGQMSKLSHYIRNLFQLVKFVDDADASVFSYEAKYNYVSSIRAQLSSHEQLLLFYNAVSVLGKPWLDAPNYLKKYCIIKSTPLPLANFYKKPLTVLGDKNEQGKVMFEWGDIKDRLNQE